VDMCASAGLRARITNGTDPQTLQCSDLCVPNVWPASGLQVDLCELVFNSLL